jgi:DNA-directed RNA polymerase II subunit RPB1
MAITTDSTILGIQFSLLSPEEIRRISVVEVTSRDTYVNNKAVAGGLFDPKMGTLEPGVRCSTDGLTYIETPGYFGHIELARPVFFIQYFDTIMDILKAVCFKCSKLLIDKGKYRAWEALPNDKRWKKINGLTGAGKLKRCGENNDDGCGCKQPSKYKKEGFASIQAELVGAAGEKVLIKMTPELVLKVLKRISDEDISFMGFSPIWSRPEWMVCQVLAVPPPAVRPSVKHDAHQRSEDDLSHSLIQIIKTNKALGDKIKHNAAAAAIEEEHLVLQYFVATMIDNKLSGAQPAAQRSGRAFKSIKDRLNGKMGRLRGNLMGKRVDYSARSVITPDPNLSIQELGVPLKIAMNITKPVLVNDRNLAFLRVLVLNGPEEYPGAKIVEKGGVQISLRYADRRIAAQTLKSGDVVHRHMVDGDYVLFNRQPSLHRMSMMGHKTRVMYKGNTFRMNVGDTKPYNADFDGDEMNMHMPQDIEAETELRHLAAVPHQIISPGSNQPIIGIFQDSLLGSFQFTRMPKGKPLDFSARDAMVLCGGLMQLDTAIFKKERVTSFDLISQILPAMSMRVRNKSYEDGSVEALVEVVNGVYKNGQLGKSVLSASSSGFIHRIFNDYGNQVSADFIDNLQYIVTEYMKRSSYSVGISDLVSDGNTASEIATAIEGKRADVGRLIQSTLKGEFKNETGKTNQEEFECKVNEILGKANEEAGKIGRRSLSKENRFVVMVNSGSKGSDINIAQMISCLGQQQVEGKRIPYGFENRTLPHFTKFDDSPEARGFIGSSFIKGLSPVALFFHAEAGRIGLIDTAVKTATTGYIQRKLVKGLEDLTAVYDGTVRNSKNRIIQFRYGEDNIDPCKVEEQHIGLAEMKLDAIYQHYNMVDVAYDAPTKDRAAGQGAQTTAVCALWVEQMVKYRDDLVECVYGFTDSAKVCSPVGFAHLIGNIDKQTVRELVDITPLEVFDLLDTYYAKLKALNHYAPTEMFRMLYYFFFSPKELLVKRRFNKAAIVLLLENVVLQYKRAVINPGEMVGVIAAQSIGEPTTQLTLNTFHFAGVASKSTVTRGTPRVEEIISLSPNPKNPSMTIYLHEPDNMRAGDIKALVEHTVLRNITVCTEIYYDPKNGTSVDATVVAQHLEFEGMVAACMGVSAQPEVASNWVVRIELDKEAMHERDITMDDVNFALKYVYEDDVHCIYSDYNDETLVFRVRLSLDLAKKKVKKALDDSDNLNKLKQFEEELLGLTLRGVRHVEKVVLRQIKSNVVKADGNYRKHELWVLDTVGTNLVDVLGLPYIDAKRTFSNDIKEIFQVFGIEAARTAIFNELTDVLEADGYINSHHKMVLCDRMTSTAHMVSMFRSGINNDDIGPIAKASFEETPEMFTKAAKHAEREPLRGVSANVMCGQEGFYGTGAFDIILDVDEMVKVKPFERPAAPEFEAVGSSIDVRNHMVMSDHAAADEEYVVDM